jgi:NitT/TauT family transport system permease protein
MNEPTGSGTPPAASSPPPRRERFTPLRGEIPLWQACLMGTLCILVVGGIWWWLTKGAEAHQRILGPTVLPSPAETFADFPSLWFDLALTRNTLVSLRRVVLGFGLASLVGVPLGVLCGCFPRWGAFFTPVTIVGRNIPVAALIPLTFSLFGIGEFQKVMFIFVACVAFIIMDSANAVHEVSSRYVDTAYTLGANRRQIILKVLTPLAMPAIFNSLRLLFGLAFGYIMLAELIKFGNESGGLGDIILKSQRRELWTYILLVLMIIPLVALAIDRLLFWIQRQLFPFQYGGEGYLHRALRILMRGGEDLRGLVRRPTALAPSNFAPQPAGSSAPAAPEKRP